MIIERAYLDLHPGDGDHYVDMFPDFKRLFMTLPGAVGTRLLRDQSKQDSFVLAMEWDSKRARDLFVADVRRKPWSATFRHLVARETIAFYDEIG